MLFKGRIWERKKKKKKQRQHKTCFIASVRQLVTNHDAFQHSLQHLLSYAAYIWAVIGPAPKHT